MQKCANAVYASRFHVPLIFVQAGEVTRLTLVEGPAFRCRTANTTAAFVAV